MRGATSLVTGGAGLLAGVAATESMNNAAKNLKIDALKMNIYKVELVVLFQMLQLKN